MTDADDRRGEGTIPETAPSPGPDSFPRHLVLALGRSTPAFSPQRIPRPSRRREMLDALTRTPTVTGP
ncbi:hypothetical protein [Salinispora arenicola]|uniref:hypothetical protein n=1 Tax=Salinispora arenicola TaxID=168697 RepID=UPI00039A44EB|nr:hypothetical protein [Salinispora arenicola]